MKNRIVLWIIPLLFGMGCIQTSMVETIGPSDTRLSNEYYQQGQDYEAKKDPIQAFKAYSLAVTVDPSNKKAVEDRARIAKTLRSLAEKHYHEGLRRYQEGQYGQGRREFLTALKYRPDHPSAIKILTTRKRIPIARYVIHEIKEGENLARIAQIYYGDQTKFPVIAQYNQLADATRLLVGQKIKIPEIQGVDFLVDVNSVQAESPYTVDFAIPPADDQWNGMTNNIIEEKKTEQADFAVIHREQGIALFERNQYIEAIVELNKALFFKPDDKDSQDYIHRSHFQLAVALFNSQNYLAAKEQFAESLKYKEDCAPCAEYLQKSEEQYKELHYKRGMQYYGKEELLEAIQEWELVVALDPAYKNVDYLINKARVIHAKIEEMKKEQKENNKKW
ncbi:MAG: LysM peptidoglycan-binding domain-containing protein [Deltaproteobacteria bacterium]|nr:LysM peptidoglycan-binding domain-containing protein [Deltaproteobacteria bacterium]